MGTNVNNTSMTGGNFSGQTIYRAPVQETDNSGQTIYHAPVQRIDNSRQTIYYETVHEIDNSGQTIHGAPVYRTDNTRQTISYGEVGYDNNGGETTHYRPVPHGYAMNFGTTRNPHTGPYDGQHPNTGLQPSRYLRRKNDSRTPSSHVSESSTRSEDAPNHPNQRHQSDYHLFATHAQTPTTIEETPSWSTIAQSSATTNKTRLETPSTVKSTRVESSTIKENLSVFESVSQTDGHHDQRQTFNDAKHSQSSSMSKVTSGNLRPGYLDIFEDVGHQKLISVLARVASDIVFHSSVWKYTETFALRTQSWKPEEVAKELLCFISDRIHLPEFKAGLLIALKKQSDLTGFLRSGNETVI